MTSATDIITIRARGLSKAYDEVLALDEFSLDVWEGSLLTLLGPSGCGKTTALRVIAGFEQATGTVEIHGRQVLGPDVFVPPERRRVGMVFQDYALFPHKTVAGNVGYGLPRTKGEARVGEVLELVGLSGLGDRMPNELSGGQQQRVALARALAPEPDVILLDEPFSGIDPIAVLDIQRLISKLKDEGIGILVTDHNVRETLRVTDRAYIINEGRILRAGTPEELGNDAEVKKVYLGDDFQLAI